MPGLRVARGIDGAVRHVAGRPLDPFDVVAELGCGVPLNSCRHLPPRDWSPPHRSRISNGLRTGVGNPVAEANIPA